MASHFASGRPRAINPLIAENTVFCAARCPRRQRKAMPRTQIFLMKK
jgi:hypothetical protein